jgi:hypothetical protein
LSKDKGGNHSPGFVNREESLQHIKIRILAAYQNFRVRFYVKFNKHTKKKYLACP